MLFKKERVCQAYLYKKIEQTDSLKWNIPYAQALYLKRICKNDPNFKTNCDILSKN